MKSSEAASSSSKSKHKHTFEATDILSPGFAPFSKA